MRELKPLTLSLALFLLVLGSLELGLRLVAPLGIEEPLENNELWPWLWSHPVLGWRNRANAVAGDVVINARHLRGPAVAARPLPGTVRIVCLGDSRTFGLWLDLGRFRFDNDYPRFLGARLRRRRDVRPTEVINAGTIGYSSSHGLRQLETQLLALEPDVLIVAFGVNEHSLAWNPALRAPDPRSALGRALLFGFADWRLLQLALDRFHHLPSIHPDPLSVPWVGPEEHAHNLRRFAALSRRHGFELLFVHLPLRPIELGENRPAFPGGDETAYPLLGATDLADLHRLQERYAALARRIAESEGVPLLEVRLGPAAFGPYDLIHPNIRGARMIARSLETSLGERGWLEAVPARRAEGTLGAPKPAPPGSTGAHHKALQNLDLQKARPVASFSCSDRRADAGSAPVTGTPKAPSGCDSTGLEASGFTQLEHPLLPASAMSQAQPKPHPEPA